MIPQFIGPLQPVQIVKVRLGRLSRYYQDNPHNVGAEGAEPMGAGHQPWDEANYPCFARVGTKASNPLRYAQPWQALWIPTTPYVVIPNVLDVKLDKKLDKQLGAVGTASVQIENILYPEKVGGYHARERGAMSPLRGSALVPNVLTPVLPQLLDELEAIVGPNEWEGRFAYAAQVTLYQGYGSTLAKTFTGLIEDLDSSSRPDRITLTCRDFGQIFTDTHFFGWGKDPIINTPVIFVDSEDASLKQDVGYNPHSSNEDLPSHPASAVLDFNEATYWQTNLVHSEEQTEYVEIALPEGVYHFAEIAAKWGGMDVYVSLRPATQAHGLAPTRQVPGELAQDMTVANKWLDNNGWVDITKAEGQIVPGVNGGNSYMSLIPNYPAGQQRTPFDKPPAGPVGYRVGNNSVLRLSFRKLHAIEGGWRAGVKEFHGLVEKTEAGAGLAQWVIVQDIADVVRIICQWAGFKEWDIPQTGVRLPKRLVVFQDKSYLDVIKEIAEGIGYIFFMADPKPDAELGGENSLGIPTFRKSRVISPDFQVEGEERARGIEANGPFRLPNRGSKRPGWPPPIITDKTLLTAIQVKQSNEPLSYVIRVYGLTKSLPGNQEAAIAGGARVVYTLRPPWTGDPSIRYADSRLGGVLKQLVLKDPLFSTVDLCRSAALFIALRQAIESIEATVEFPALPGTLDLDDHAQLMDLGTGISTRLAITSRSSHFVDGEKRKFVMTLSGPLIDTPDVRDMVDIINGIKQDNGAGGEWVDPRLGSGSSLGYG